MLASIDWSHFTSHQTYGKKASISLIQLDKLRWIADRREQTLKIDLSASYPQATNEESLEPHCI